MAVLKIRDENGQVQEIVALRGEKGQDGTVAFDALTDAQKASLKGEVGEAGYTPVRGVDFWTETDKAEMRAYIDEQFGDVNTALDSVIALQQSLIGGETA